MNKIFGETMMDLRSERGECLRKDFGSVGWQPVSEDKPLHVKVRRIDHFGYKPYKVTAEDWHNQYE